MKIQIYGNLSQIGAARSWGLVMSNIALAIKKAGHEIACYSSNGQANIDPRVRPYLVNELDSKEPVFTYCSPPELIKINTEKIYCMTAYESSILPKGWADMLNIRRVQVIVNSVQQQVMMKDNGVKAVVVPLGVDPEIYKPEGHRLDLGKKYKFLSVGIPHYRKGFDILLQAFAEEFEPDEPVAVVLKTEKITKPNYWEIDIVNEIKKVQRKRKTAEIMLVTGDAPDLAGLYRACQCYVSPSRGEGWGLTIYEAAACGLPVISTITKKFSSKTIKAPFQAQYHTFNPNATIKEPSLIGLKQCLRFFYANKMLVIDTTFLTWENSARQLLNIMGAPDPDGDFNKWVNKQNEAVI
jgi:glycosyltransferase involved in cell wall biosynthesis